MSEKRNLRYELRAYESAGCCRLASFILRLMPPDTVDRDAVADLWAEQYPRHTTLSGKNNVRGRISSALTLLKTAGIAQPVEGQAIEVVSHEHLRLVAGNLAIVEDAQGIAVPPSLWSERPLVPDYLQEVQAALEQQRQQAAAE